MVGKEEMARTKIKNTIWDTSDNADVDASSEPEFMPFKREVNHVFKKS